MVRIQPAPLHRAATAWALLLLASGRTVAQEPTQPTGHGSASASRLRPEPPSPTHRFVDSVLAHLTLADVLFGDVNPSGKFPVTIPRTVGQVPIYYSHKNTGRPPDEKEHFTSKYLDVAWTPLYRFGHGLSYTTFRYDSLRLDAPRIRAGDTLVVHVDVTNTGDRTGDEVVQLYIRDEVASVTRPVDELRTFQRITLRPGERRTVWFTLHPDDLALYDLGMRHVVEPGFFRVFVGTSSADVQEARFEVTG